MGDQHLFGHGVAPLGSSGNDEQGCCRGLQARHLVRVAQTAILSRLVFVPVDKNQRQAE